MTRPPASGEPPGATFLRAYARTLGFDSEFDAAVSLCQGAYATTAPTTETPELLLVARRP